MSWESQFKKSSRFLWINILFLYALKCSFTLKKSNCIIIIIIIIIIISKILNVIYILKYIFHTEFLKFLYGNKNTIIQ